MCDNAIINQYKRRGGISRPRETEAGTRMCWSHVCRGMIDTGLELSGEHGSVVWIIMVVLYGVKEKVKE